MLAFLKKNGLLILGSIAIIYMLTRQKKSELDQLIDQANANLDAAKP